MLRQNQLKFTEFFIIKERPGNVLLRYLMIHANGVTKVLLKCIFPCKVKRNQRGSESCMNHVFASTLRSASQLKRKRRERKKTQLVRHQQGNELQVSPSGFLSPRVAFHLLSPTNCFTLVLINSLLKDDAVQCKLVKVEERCDVRLSSTQSQRCC